MDRYRYMHEVNIRWKRPLDGRDIVTEQTDYFDDRIADAILHGSPYERLRVRRNSLFDQRIPTKLAWQSAILLLLSLVAPITLGYSGAVAALFPGATPLASSPVILMPGVLALVIETGAAAGHLAVAATLLSGESDLSTRRMRQLLSVEEMASFYGLIGGALLLGDNGGLLPPRLRRGGDDSAVHDGGNAGAVRCLRDGIERTRRLRRLLRRKRHALRGKSTARHPNAVVAGTERLLTFTAYR